MRTAALLVALLNAAITMPARAQENASSELSAVSMMPVAISVAAPVLLVAGASSFVVVAVETVGAGTSWVLERASDGARTGVQFAGAASAAVGTAVSVTVVATGWILSAAGTAIAFIPNEVGRALMHNERISR